MAFFCIRHDIQLGGESHYTCTEVFNSLSGCGVWRFKSKMKIAGQFQKGLNPRNALIELMRMRSQFLWIETNFYLFVKVFLRNNWKEKKNRV